MLKHTIEALRIVTRRSSVLVLVFACERQGDSRFFRQARISFSFDRIVHRAQREGSKQHRKVFSHCAAEIVAFAKFVRLWILKVQLLNSLQRLLTANNLTPKSSFTFKSFDQTFMHICPQFACFLIGKSF